MDAAEWFRWAAAFFLGALSTIAIEFGRGQFERHQRMRDRRDDAERETLTQLQDSVYEMIRAATSLIAHREGVLAELGEWRIEQAYTAPEPAAFMAAYTRAGILAVRVQDEPIRICVEALRAVVDGAIGAKHPDAGRTEWAKVADILDDTNGRIGGRLRKL